MPPMDRPSPIDDATEHIQKKQRKFFIGFAILRTPSLDIETLIAIERKDAKVVRRKTLGTASLLQSMRNEPKHEIIVAPSILPDSGNAEP